MSNPTLMAKAMFWDAFNMSSGKLIAIFRNEDDWTEFIQFAADELKKFAAMTNITKTGTIMFGNGSTIETYVTQSNLVPTDNDGIYVFDFDNPDQDIEIIYVEDGNGDKGNLN